MEQLLEFTDISPITMFLFYTKSCRSGEDLIDEISNRGDFTFEWRMSSVHKKNDNTLPPIKFAVRLFLLEKINYHVIEMLNAEFDAQSGYEGYLAIDEKILDDTDYDDILQLDAECKEFMRGRLQGRNTR